MKTTAKKSILLLSLLILSQSPAKAQVAFELGIERMESVEVQHDSEGLAADFPLLTGGKLGFMWAPNPWPIGFGVSASEFVEEKPSSKNLHWKIVDLETQLRWPVRSLRYLWVRYGKSIYGKKKYEGANYRFTMSGYRIGTGVRLGRFGLEYGERYWQLDSALADRAYYAVRGVRLNEIGGRSRSLLLSMNFTVGGRPWWVLSGDHMEPAQVYDVPTYPGEWNRE